MKSKKFAPNGKKKLIFLPPSTHLHFSNSNSYHEFQWILHTRYHVKYNAHIIFYNTQSHPLIISLISQRKHLSFVEIEYIVSYHSKYAAENWVKQSKKLISLPLFYMTSCILVLCSPLVHLETTTELYCWLF